MGNPERKYYSNTTCNKNTTKWSECHGNCQHLKRHYVELCNMRISIFFLISEKYALSYLGVFRRHFAPAILSTKSQISSVGAGGKGKVQWPRRVIVPGTLSGPDAHPRPEHWRNPRLLHCDWRRTGGGLMDSTRCVNSSTPLPDLRVCLTSAECRRRSSAWIKLMSCTTQARAWIWRVRAHVDAHLSVQTEARAHVRSSSYSFCHLEYVNVFLLRGSENEYIYWSLCLSKTSRYATLTMNQHRHQEYS